MHVQMEKFLLQFFQVFLDSVSSLEIPIKLTFLYICWYYATPHPSGNFNPFCGGSMGIFLNSTFQNLFSPPVICLS